MSNNVEKMLAFNAASAADNQFGFSGKTHSI